MFFGLLTLSLFVLKCETTFAASRINSNNLIIKSAESRKPISESSFFIGGHFKILRGKNAENLKERCRDLNGETDKLELIKFPNETVEFIGSQTRGSFEYSFCQREDCDTDNGRSWKVPDTAHEKSKGQIALACKLKSADIDGN